MDPSSFDLAESKLHAPAARRGIVARTPLLHRIATADSTAVVSVVAPAGYGKTTFLAQWAEPKSPQVGWVSVDERDNDPVVLLSYIAVALDRIEAIDPRVFRALASSGASAGREAPRWLVAAMDKMSRPGALVIDNLEAVTNSESLDAVAEAWHWGCRMVGNSRSVRGPPCPCQPRDCAPREASWRSAQIAWPWGRQKHGRCSAVPASNSRNQTWTCSSSEPKAGPPGCTSQRWR